MADRESGFKAGGDEDDGPPPIPPPKRSPDQVSAWMLTGWMVLAPLLMLITIWVLTAFRKH